MMMPKQKHWLYVILILAIIGIIFLSGCIKQDVNQEQLEINQTSEKKQPAFQSSSELKFEWERDSGIRVADAGVPDVHKLEGERYRLYYHGPGGILSAISSDGLNFEKESGARIMPEGKPGSEESMVSDPSVVSLMENGIRMYYKGANGPGGPGKAVHKIFSAVSTNGLDFEKEGVRINPKKTSDNGWASVPGAVILEDGKVRIYYVSGAPEAEGGIMSAISGNGLNFEKEKGVRIKGFVDPTVTILPNQKYLLLAAVLPSPPGAPQKTEYPVGIYSFISEDGLNFENPKIVLQERAIDPSIVQVDDQTYRVYYGSENEQGEPVIKSVTGRLNIKNN